MKRIVCLLLILMLPAVSIAEIDLSALTFDELISLRQAAIAEIMQRPEWTETTLEAGAYRIGRDIPSGYYRAHPLNSYMEIHILDGSKEIDFIMVYGEDIGKLYLEDGLTVKTNGTIILSPYTGV